MVGSADELRALLPAWVVWGAWFATPLVCITVGVLFTWIADRANRPRLDGLHWTEVARLHHGGSVIVNAQSMSHAGLTGVATYMLGSGSLTALDPVQRAILAGLGVWLGSRIVHYYRARRVLPGLTLGAFVRGQLFYLLLFLPVLVLALAMACLGPEQWTGSELGFVLVYGGGVVAIGFMIRGGGIPIGRLFGLFAPADQRTRAIVDEASRRTGHTVRRAWVANTPVANAAALPATNELLVTSKALELMDDRQLVAVMLHELGHLREKSRDRWSRMVGIGFFVVFGMWRPIHGWLGLGGLLGALALLFGLALLGARAARRLEVEADDHAHQHIEEGEEGIYARALERMYEINLSPAVMRGQGGTHPHLYDRMVSAGVTPDYERPAPPPANTRKMVVFGIVAVAAFVCEAQWIEHRSEKGYESVDAAYEAIMWSGGKVVPIGALAYHWQDSDPSRAKTVLEFVAPRSDSAEYPARLAIILAGSDTVAAREQLQRAERLYQQLGRENEWLRDLLDDATARLKAAEGR